MPVKKSAPVRYVVKKGDTLWSISRHFFDSPWLWPEVWYENPAIHNPHLIYPGDVITLTNVGGKPELTVRRGGNIVRTTSPALREHMLKPKVQRTALAKAVPTIPYDAISSLLSKPRVMSAKDYARAPYVLRPVDGRMLAAAPNPVYVRGIAKSDDDTGNAFAVVRKRKPLHDPKTGKLLGFEVIYLGRGVITATGDPSTLKLQHSTQEISGGDRLVPVDTGVVPAQFPLLTPRTSIKGQVIDVVGGMEQVGQYQVIVLDRGEKAGLKTGDVLAVRKPGNTVDDPYAHGSLSGDVKLPSRRVGEAVVFRTFSEVSFALVMRATQPVRTGYSVTNP